VNVCLLNILRTLWQTIIRFLIELLVHGTWFKQFKLYFILNWLVMRCKIRPELVADSMIENVGWSQVKSIYFHHPSLDNSTNYYLILGLQDKAVPPTSQQIPSEASEEPSVIHFSFSSSTGELCSQPVRGNDRRIGWMFPEHVEQNFLDPKYSFAEYFQLALRRKVCSIKNQLASLNTSN